MLHGLRRPRLPNHASRSRRRPSAHSPKPKRAEKPPRPTLSQRQKSSRVRRARNPRATGTGRTKASPRIFEPTLPLPDLTRASEVGVAESPGSSAAKALSAATVNRKERLAKSKGQITASTHSSRPKRRRIFRDAGQVLEHRRPIRELPNPLQVMALLQVTHDALAGRLG
jgi:hypothetical protein